MTVPIRQVDRYRALSLRTHSQSLVNVLMLCIPQSSGPLALVLEIVQVVADLVSQHFPDTALEAVQIAQTGEYLSDHLNKAGTPGTYEYSALSSESVEKWDYVILQVRQPLCDPCTCQSMQHPTTPVN